jgi:hypothetical protein
VGQVQSVAADVDDSRPVRFAVGAQNVNKLPVRRHGPALAAIGGAADHDVAVLAADADDVQGAMMDEER